jgi:hypothetical protein
MCARTHRGVGKSDVLDAHRIAAAVLPLREEQLRRPRLNDGVRAALRILVTAVAVNERMKPGHGLEQGCRLRG